MKSEKKFYLYRVLILLGGLGSGWVMGREPIDPERHDLLRGDVAVGLPSPARSFPSAPGTQEGRAARRLDQEIRQFRGYREQKPFALWTVNPNRIFRVRPKEECFADLRSKGVPFVEAETAWPFRRNPPRPNPMPAGVLLTGSMHGVEIVGYRAERFPVFACEMAVRLEEFSRFARRWGIRKLGLMSAFRWSPQASFHIRGFGMDIAWLELDEGSPLLFERPLGWGWFADLFESHQNRRFVVLNSFPRQGSRFARRVEGRRRTTTCLPSYRSQFVWVDFACSLYEEQIFNTVITPNYNRGHRNHFHFDARPGDSRFFGL